MIVDFNSSKECINMIKEIKEVQFSMMIMAFFLQHIVPSVGMEIGEYLACNGTTA